jgi:hypothetical protein
MINTILAALHTHETSVYYYTGSAMTLRSGNKINHKPLYVKTNETGSRDCALEYSFVNVIV